MPRVLLLALLFVVTAAPAAAQGFAIFNGRNHPEIDWRVAETEHFQIVYPAHLAGIEAEAAPIAEATYAALSYDFGNVTFDDPIRIYLSDEDEIANGVAFEFGGGVSNIWVHVNDFAEVWTGDVKWLRKVMSHEIAHLFHYRATHSGLGLLQNLVADPLPSFWAEGLAQYMTERWDAQRGDRWLRTAVFDDRLNYSDGTSAWNGRLKYSLGNSQVRYLAEHYGDSTIVRLLRHRREAIPGLPRVHDFYAAFRAATGKTYAQFYDEWRRHVNVYYNTIAGQMERPDSLHARPMRLPGEYVYDVQYSPDTSRIAAVVLTSVARPVRRLYVMNNVRAARPREGGRVSYGLRILAEGGVDGPVAWSPDGSRIAYAREVRGRYGSLLRDLYVVDVATGRNRRLTRNRRASSPTFAPDGRLAFVGVDGTTANLFLLDTETGEETPITRFTGDVQITTARWSPTSTHIAVAVFTGEGRRELLVVEPGSGESTVVAADEGVAPETRDPRQPVWRPDGRALAFTSLRDDVPNVFVVSVGDVAMDEVPDATPAPTDSLAAAVEAVLPSLPHPRDSTSTATAPGDSSVARELTGAVPADSLRAGAFHGQRAAVPSTREARITYLFNGAEVHGWLPPDARHPEGRLVVVSSETKRRDRAYVIDAARRPTVDASTPPTVPLGYATWTEHRPPVEIPWSIPPDSSLIRRRFDYCSICNLAPAITLPLPYADPGEDGHFGGGDDDIGVFANSIWIEPLNKHQLFILAGVSFTRFIDRSFLLLEYTNNTHAPAITLDLYRFPSPASFYGDALLVENLTGGDVSATLPLDVTDRAYTTVLAGARVRYAYAEPYDLNADSLDLEAAGGTLPVPEDGFRADLQLGFAFKFQRPYRWNVIYPLDGLGARARVTLGAPVLGSENRFVRPDLSAYWVTPQVGIGRFYAYARGTAVFGRPLVQDYVGLAKYDDVDVQLPLVGAVTLDEAERVRGYREYAVGTRALFGTLEYRLPPVLDLQTNLLGIVRLGRISPTLFVDAGVVWNDDFSESIRRVGAGFELKNVVSLGGLELLQSVGVALPGERIGATDLTWDDVDLYYRLQAAVAF